MAATAAQIARLRRMVNELDDTTYDDDTLADYIEAYPHMDELGTEPYSWDYSTTPPSQDANEDWIPTYDLHSAAADLLEEKAAVAAQDFAFNADGGSYQRNQVYEQYMAKVRFHRSRRMAKTARLQKWPEESGRSGYPNWVGNAPESDD